MKIKLHTLVKGIVWELIGVSILASYIWYTTGDPTATSTIGLGYPALRAVTFYPYERLCKAIRRIGEPLCSTCHGRRQRGEYDPVAYCSECQNRQVRKPWQGASPRPVPKPHIPEVIPPPPLTDFTTREMRCKKYVTSTVRKQMVEFANTVLLDLADFKAELDKLKEQRRQDLVKEAFLTQDKETFDELTIEHTVETTKGGCILCNPASICSRCSDAFADDPENRSMMLDYISKIVAFLTTLNKPIVSITQETPQ